jgi:hypothetical protein
MSTMELELEKDIIINSNYDNIPNKFRALINSVTIYEKEKINIIVYDLNGNVKKHVCNRSTLKDILYFSGTYSNFYTVDPNFQVLTQARYGKIIDHKYNSIKYEKGKRVNVGGLEVNVPKHINVSFMDIFIDRDPQGLLHIIHALENRLLHQNYYIPHIYVEDLKIYSVNLEDVKRINKIVNIRESHFDNIIKPAISVLINQPQMTNCIEKYFSNIGNPVIIKGDSIGGNYHCFNLPKGIGIYNFNLILSPPNGSSQYTYFDILEVVNSLSIYSCRSDDKEILLGSYSGLFLCSMGMCKGNEDLKKSGLSIPIKSIFFKRSDMAFSEEDTLRFVVETSTKCNVCLGYLSSNYLGNNKKELTFIHTFCREKLVKTYDSVKFYIPNIKGFILYTTRIIKKYKLYMINNNNKILVSSGLVLSNSRIYIIDLISYNSSVEFFDQLYSVNFSECEYLLDLESIGNGIIHCSLVYCNNLSFTMKQINVYKINEVVTI